MFELKVCVARAPSPAKGWSAFLLAITRSPVLSLTGDLVLDYSRFGVVLSRARRPRPMDIFAEQKLLDGAV